MMGNKIEFDFTRLTSPGGVKLTNRMNSPVNEDINEPAPSPTGRLSYETESGEKDYETSTGLEIVHSQMPMNVRKINTTEWIPFPLEPLVSVSTKNVIVRRNVAKARNHGTIEERWSQDDFEVTIQGMLTTSSSQHFPANHVRTLLNLFQEKQAIEVDQEMLLTMGIKFLAIQSISFPHTKGINNQQFEIKAYSDTQAELLINS
ncbi:MAG: DUF6046 domain-containing protein [Tannerellaceae bacterium]|nr:DUF6046 domain-containing protein [Tannerellaceae bacterium]